MGFWIRKIKHACGYTSFSSLNQYVNKRDFDTFPLLQIYQFIGNLVVSMMVAFVASLAFESPMMGLEKIIFKKQEKKRR